MSSIVVTCVSSLALIAISDFPISVIRCKAEQLLHLTYFDAIASFSSMTEKTANW